MTLMLLIAKMILGESFPLKNEGVPPEKLWNWRRERACLISALSIVTALLLFVFVVLG